MFIVAGANSLLEQNGTFLADLEVSGRVVQTGEVDEIERSYQTYHVIKILSGDFLKISESLLSLYTIPCSVSFTVQHYTEQYSSGQYSLLHTISCTYVDDTDFSIVTVYDVV